MLYRSSCHAATLSMTAFDDLPGCAVSLITRYAHGLGSGKRYVPGTNRFAPVCRSWRDATPDSHEHEQLQLLLALEGLPTDTVTSTSDWLARHGACVTSLHISYNPQTAPLFQQLPLSTAPLVGLGRLEVDAPDSLVALAPALPQLVALTHLRASIGLVAKDSSTQDWSEAVFSAQGVPLETSPSLQQLCPGLKSLHLTMGLKPDDRHRVIAPVAQVLPASLEQLSIHNSRSVWNVGFDSAALTSLTALRHLSLVGLAYKLEPLFHVPALDQMDLRHVCGMAEGDWSPNLFDRGPQQQAKLAGYQTGSLWSVSQDMQSLMAAAPGLCKLRLVLHQPDAGVVAWVQQLSSLSALRHLHLSLDCLHYTDEVIATVPALSGAQQLTYLRLSIGKGRVERESWDKLLPNLSQLRVLAVKEKQVLYEGLPAKVALLPQLQCLYVEGSWGLPWDPAATGAEVVPHLQALSKCSSLKAVLCWAPVMARGEDDQEMAWPGRRRLGMARQEAPAAHCMWQYVHEGRVQLSCWHGWRHAAEEGLVVCPQACPHLPGVWRVQQLAPCATSQLATADAVGPAEVSDDDDSSGSTSLSDEEGEGAAA